MSIVINSGDRIKTDLNFHFYIPCSFKFFKHWYVFFFNQIENNKCYPKLRTKFAADHKALHK